jgi:hypothetical protein
MSENTKRTIDIGGPPSKDDADTDTEGLGFLERLERECVREINSRLSAAKKRIEQTIDKLEPEAKRILDEIERFKRRNGIEGGTGGEGGSGDGEAA